MITRYNPGEGQFLQQSTEGEYVAWADYAAIANTLRRLWHRRQDGPELEFWDDWEDAVKLLTEHGLNPLVSQKENERERENRKQHER